MNDFTINLIKNINRTLDSGGNITSDTSIHEFIDDLSIHYRTPMENPLSFVLIYNPFTFQTTILTTLDFINFEFNKL